jgi:phospholipase C
MKKIIFLAMVFLLLASCAPSTPSVSQNSSAPINIAQPTVPPTAAAPTSLPVTGKQAAVPPPVATPIMATPTAAPSTNQTSPTSAPGQKGTVPNFDHIVLILLENEGYDSIINNSSMPNFNKLAKQYVLLTSYYAVSHPSLPNYIALMSGSTQGITSDCTDCFVNAPNLGDLIENSGRTWKAYEESMPSPCFIGNADPYAQKHDPLLYFDSIRTNATRCDQSIVPMTQLDSDLAANKLPNFAFIMPNLCNSGHDCPVATADQWLGQMIGKLQSSPALGSNSLIIVTFDEGSTSDKSSCCGMAKKAGGKVATLLISPMAKPGFSDDTQYSHYSLLKTILTAWNLPDLGQTHNSGTQPITAPWH